MNHHASARKSLATAIACAAFYALTAASPGIAESMKITLSGDQEVPPVTTSATGTGTITVNPDRTLTGSVMTKGLNGNAAHIHEGPKGQNGPVVIPLTKSGDNTWSVPAGAKLTDAQVSSLQAGNLYVNVHTTANPNGEIRAQLGP